MSNSSFWPIHITLSGAMLWDQNGPGINSNKEVLYIYQSYIDWSLATRCFNVISWFWSFYHSAEMQSLDFTAPAHWAANETEKCSYAYEKTHNIVPQSWIIECLRTYKIAKKVIMEETMKNGRVELKEGGKSYAEVKTKRGIFPGDALSPLLFVIPMTLLHHIPRKCTGKYKFTKSSERIIILMYIDHIKLFAT